ncbi:hypothetical protein PT974_10139 [Cladobotryum mycophilum]|uniref:AB hydrolase-1 domain-containing protein n=1 Tax=Cladobotryum mycophilum TaxID=491253 RepID=A0ABR0S8Z6_9HYPO
MSISLPPPRPAIRLLQRQHQEGEQGHHTGREASRPLIRKEAAVPPDAFPGARDVETPYGTTKVFEWGPEDGEKVLLIHGMSTPSIALGDMAWEMVGKGYRVMLFDLFGRGYSDAPTDIPYDERLYNTQILLVLASSSLPWTGAAAFHILGYSLGGALAVAFAAYHSNLLRSVTAICPAGLVRPSHLGWEDRLYWRSWLPEWFLRPILRRRLQPVLWKGEELPLEVETVHWDLVPCSVEEAYPRVGDVMEWQLEANGAFAHTYLSTLRHAPVYGQHDGIWKLLGDRMARNREHGQGLGRLCLILGENDALTVRDEWTEDSKAVLGEDGVDIHVVKGHHSIAMTKGREVANIAINSWREGQR